MSQEQNAEGKLSDDESLEDEEPEMIELPAVIDLEQIRAWHRICRSTHGDCCNDRYSEHLARHLDSLTLVDTHSDSLVVLPTSTPYVALSYVWGNVPIFKTQKSNFEDLKRPGALAQDGIGIPATICDAINLVKSLGKQYLWVDCLCIVQDQEQEEMDKMLRAMAYIYASAEFTIVDGFGSDASHGLRGLGGPQRCTPRFVDKNYPSMYDLYYPFESVWASRGWTFQESFFSRRLLIFGKVIHWICGLVIWVEDDNFSSNTTSHLRLIRITIFDEHDDFVEHKMSESGSASSSIASIAKRSHIDMPMGFMSLISRLPHLGHWSTVVRCYNPRSLTFETDIDRALAGVIQSLGSKFPGGILHGLPVFFFDIVLLWQNRPSTRLERRRGQPSWSWMGWKGRVETFIHWGRYAPEITYLVEGSSDWIARTTLGPVATFRLPLDAHKGAGEWWRTPVFSDFYNYQYYRTVKNAPLPKGWLRHYHPAGDYFTCSTSVQANTRYAFPLPIADPAQSGNPSSPVLICTAPHTTVWLQYHQNYSVSDVGLLKVNSKVVGSFLFDDDSFREAAACEVIAISEATFTNAGVWKFAFAYCPECYITYDDVNEEDSEQERAYYNVMCIGWEDDTAYRRGLGMVKKEDWLALGAKYITFKLG